MTVARKDATDKPQLVSYENVGVARVRLWESVRVWVCGKQRNGAGRCFRCSHRIQRGEYAWRILTPDQATVFTRVCTAWCWPRTREGTLTYAENKPRDDSDFVPEGH
jgi:hypothetical protein